jgi:PST family polysaccharide transporter
VQGILSLAAALVMARLLVPGDFGVFAMVVPLGILATIAANQCPQAAFLQHPLTDDADIQGYYRFVRRVALVSAVGMAALGLAIAWLYDESRVIGVTLAWAVVVAGMSRAAIQEALLKRDLRFPIVFGVQLSTWFFGLAVGVIAAWRGVGYWAMPLHRGADSPCCDAAGFPSLDCAWRRG